MKLSIITVVLNDHHNIEKTIQSIFYQNIKLEYIVVDGRSTDGTLEIIEKYKDNIDILISQKDSGIYNAMNKAIEMASGEWICFMNSGDVFYSTSVLQDFSVKMSDKDVDVYYGDHEVNYEEHTKIVKANNKIEDIWKRMVFSHQSCFVKKEVLSQYKFNESNKITADYELFYTLYKANKRFDYIPIVLSSVSAGGVSDIKRIDSIVSRWNILEKSNKVNIYYLKLIIVEMLKSVVKKVLGKGS